MQAKRDDERGRYARYHRRALVVPGSGGLSLRHIEKKFFLKLLNQKIMRFKKRRSFKKHGRRRGGKPLRTYKMSRGGIRL